MVTTECFADRVSTAPAWRREAAAEVKPPIQLLSYRPGRFVAKYLWLIAWETTMGRRRR